MTANPPAVESDGKRRFSIAKIKDHWYIACPSAALRNKPLARTILDVRLVLFRDGTGRASALLDRCAHRNVPLSLGLVEDGHLVCGYHGWAFDCDGICQKVPALTGEQTGKARRVPRYPVREQQGYIWVYMNPEVEPALEPYSFMHVDAPGYTVVRFDTSLRSTLHAALENILDVPHTAYLHRGLFRGGTQNAITAVIRRYTDRVEAEYLNEPRPSGLMPQLLAPKDAALEHTDRFVLPSIAQVEYRLGTANHVMVTSALTPISDFETHMYSLAVAKTRVPGFLLKSILLPLGKKVVAQDKVMLAEQTDSVQRFGGEQYVHTEVDLLGPHIWRLLRQAERGDAPNDDVKEQRVEILV